MNIDTMPAGRELDALVAERVMGWKLFASEPGYGRPPHQITLVLTPVPPYSTSDPVALAIIERLRVDALARGERWDTSITVAYDGLCVVNIYHRTVIRDEPLAYSGFCSSIALAICRAALKAMEATSD